MREVVSQFVVQRRQVIRDMYRMLQLADLSIPSYNCMERVKVLCYGAGIVTYFKTSSPGLLL